MNALEKLTSATRMLAEARTLEDVRHVRDIAAAAEQYAKAAKLGEEAEHYAADIRLRAGRKAGEMLAQAKEAGELDRGAAQTQSRNGTTFKLDDIGITRNQSSAWQTLASVPEDEFEEVVENAKERGAMGDRSVAQFIRNGKSDFPLTASNHAPSLDPNYDGDEWYTPTEIIEAARQVMGSIDLDPASCYEAQRVVQAAAYYTKEDNALDLNLAWAGNVWMNPPYSAQLVDAFIERVIDEYNKGAINQAIILTNNSSETGWFQYALQSSGLACFPKSRLKFWRKGGNNFAARQGQTVFYFGLNSESFIQVFSRIGTVVEVANG